MIRVTVDEAKDRLAELIEAALRGEGVYIDIDGEQGKREVQLVSGATGLPARGFGSMRGRLWISETFDDPLDDFADYQK